MCKKYGAYFVNMTTAFRRLPTTSEVYILEEEEEVEEEDDEEEEEDEEKKKKYSRDMPSYTSLTCVP